MPAPRINMRKLKDALRLKFEGQQSHQQIATALGISKGVVTKYAGLAIAARLDWPAIAAMDEASLERRLLPAPRPSDLFAPADYGRIHQELRRKGMTLALLWEEYCAETADLYSADHPVKPWRYSQFCENYRRFAKSLERSTRQIHRAGEKLFIDFARHYGCSMLPARAYHPQDKAKVELSVQLVERWILARLRIRICL